MAIKILIIEDDIIIAENLKENLEILGYVITGIAADFKEANELYENQLPDACIVDIALKGSAKNGIEIMEYLGAGDIMPIIYLTSFDSQKFREMAKGTNPSAYLVKPASKFQVDVTIDFALSNFRKSKLKESTQVDLPSCPYITKSGFFYVRSRDRYEKIYAHKIDFVMASGSYVKIYSLEKVYTLSAGLKSFLAQLKSLEIVRCHRSYAVNINNIEAFDDVNLFLKSGNEIHSIPMSKQYKSDVQLYLRKIKAD